jgi:hypothetical protein
VVFITSAYGLGETVVQGAVNPDEFYLYKPNIAAGLVTAEAARSNFVAHTVRASFLLADVLMLMPSITRRPVPEIALPSAEEGTAAVTANRTD